MNDGNPFDLPPLNRLTDDARRSIDGTTHQQQLIQPPLANFLNQVSNQQPTLQLLENSRLNQSLIQSIGQRLSQPLHHGLLRKVLDSLSPSAVAGFRADFQSQLSIPSLAGTSSQSTDLLLAIEKQNILDRARALNQLEIRRALERQQEQANLQRNQIASVSRPQEQLARVPQIPTNLQTPIDSSLGQPLQVNIIGAVVARALTPSSSDDTNITSEPSPPSSDNEQVSPPILPFAVGEAGVKDLRMVQDNTWEARFRDLEQFKLQHRHCNVPRRYKGNPKLGVWVCSLRQQKTRGSLNKAKVERLNQIGFQWRIAFIKGAQINPRQTVAKVVGKWNENFQHLASIKKRTGSLKVPTSNRKLYNWVYKQRREMEKGKLSVEKQEKLNSIGFQWKQPRTYDKRQQASDADGDD